MSLLIVFLTFVLVLNCLLLMLLILIQLPKKEAGAGLAFGGGATDALFGAGSGNALTKMTKYAATFFVGLSLTLSLLNAYRSKEGGRLLERAVEQAAGALTPTPPATGTSTPLTTTLPAPPQASPAVPVEAAPPTTNPQGTPPATTPAPAPPGTPAANPTEPPK
ncbi:MAG: preprotein translocase subunit SecG [Verrucomicrobia bacterium]|nr:preprotein translocase subunit SecG [Verrucomicrobiota bacterium]